ncbi:MAG: ATP-binding protein [Candidatus Thorarchaeota archaeon]
MTTRLMVDNNPTASLSRAYREMHPNQYLREMYYNSVEAGATFTRIRPVNSIKMAFCDDGHGMNPEDLELLINGRNSSSKNTEGYHGNFGVGLKDSALTPNPYGLVIASRTKDKRKGGMIWLHQDEGVSGAKMLVSDEMFHEFEHDLQGLHSFVGQYGNHFYSIDFESIQSDFGYESFTIDGVDWMKIFEDCSANTVVVLMGQSADDVTFGENKDYTWLSSRLFSTPIPLKVPTYRSTGLRWESVQTVSNLDCPKYTQKYKDFEVTTWIKDFPPPNRSTTSRIKSRMIFTSGVKYNEEVYHYIYDSSANGRERAERAARRWGLYYPKISRRVVIIVEPPKKNGKMDRGCYPDSVRTNLLFDDPETGYSERDINSVIAEVQDWYIDNMPKELRELINEQVQEVTKHVERSNKLKEYLKIWSAPKVSKASKASSQGKLFIDQDGSEAADEDSLVGQLLKGRKISAPSRSDSVDTEPRPPASNKAKQGKEGESSSAERRKKRPSPDEVAVIFVKPGHQAWSVYESLAGSRGRAGALFPFAYTGIRPGDQANIVYVNEEASIINDLIDSALMWVSKRGVARLPMSRSDCLHWLVKKFITDYLPITLSHLNADSNKVLLDLDITDPALLYAAFHGTWQIRNSLADYYDAYRNYMRSPKIEVH